MKTTKVLLLVFTLSMHFVFAQENSDTQKVEHSYLKLPRIKVIPIKDTKNNRQYELYVKLPEGYAENEETQYPVLYYTDAIWHVEILSASTEYIMENTILVGISWQKDIDKELFREVGEHVSRHRDYSVSPTSNPEHQAKYQFGQAGNHLDFIRNDVITYVERNYRTAPENRSYFGYSAGGLFGAYTLVAQPDTFKNYILGSPSLWRDVPYLTELASNKNLNANVFISNGDLEEKLSTHVYAFVAMLKNKNDESLRLAHVVINGNHQTAFPLTGVRSITWLSNIIKEVKETD